MHRHFGNHSKNIRPEPDFFCLECFGIFSSSFGAKISSQNFGVSLVQMSSSACHAG